MAWFQTRNFDYFSLPLRWQGLAALSLPFLLVGCQVFTLDHLATKEDLANQQVWITTQLEQQDTRQQQVWQHQLETGFDQQQTGQQHLQSSLRHLDLRFDQRLVALERQLAQQQTADPQGQRLRAPAQHTLTVEMEGKLLLGRQEWVAFPEQRLILPARIDSGANTSSLHAVNLQEFERDGEAWLRFETHYQSQESEDVRVIPIEAPLVRQVRIRQASGSESRPVIRLPMRLANRTESVEFTLTDRGEMTFPVLLGRRYMMDLAVIDVAREYVQGRPELPAIAEPETAEPEEEAAAETTTEQAPQGEAE